MVLEIGGRWCTTVVLWDVAFSICSIQLVTFVCSAHLVFFSIYFISVHMVHLYSRIDTTAARKKSHFILSDRLDFHMIDNLSITVHAFAMSFLHKLLGFDRLSESVMWIVLSENHFDSF